MNPTEKFVKNEKSVHDMLCNCENHQKTIAKFVEGNEKTERRSQRLDISPGRS